MKSVITRHWTIRVRLTVLYGGLVLLAGALVLGVTFLLVQQRFNQQERSYDQAQKSAILTKKGLMTGGPRAEAAARERYREHLLNELLTQGGIALGGVGVLAGAFGWVLAGRALRPVHRMTETARRIAGTDGAGRGLHERIGLDGPPDEIKELADTFDVMLERLDASFDGQRRFVAGASHEMRTPLAINRALIEVSITRPDASADARELGEALLDVNDRHQRLIDGLLTLADSENEVTQRLPVDLAEVTEAVLTEMAGTAREHGVEVLPPTLHAALTSGDPYLLERLVQNLTENAIRHNVRRGGWLTARTWSSANEVVLTVTNSGAVVHAYEAETLFQPFRRIDDRRATPPRGSDRGFGLGLSIVRAIARAHGGTARATPLDGGGLTVTVTLPRRQAGTESPGTPAPPPPSEIALPRGTDRTADGRPGPDRR